MLNKLKEIVGNYYLKRELKNFSRERKVSNFENGRSFALLFDAAIPEDYELVKKYLKYLKEAKKKVKAIGYFNTKHLPPMEYVKLDYDFFTKKEITWYGKPTHKLVNNFLEEEFDVLINFSLNNTYPLHYLAALSKAKFKIGRSGDFDEIYDMLIEQPSDKNFKFFMRQIDHYLGIIDKP